MLFSRRTNQNAHVGILSIHVRLQKIFDACVFLTCNLTDTRENSFFHFLRHTRPSRSSTGIIRQQPTTITEFDETLVKRLIAKITVFEDRFTIDFKSGVTIDIEA